MAINSINPNFNTSKQITPSKQDSLQTQQPQVIHQKKEGISTLAKVGIWTAVAIGVAVIADFVFAKGKHLKNILKSGEKEAQTKVTQEAKAKAEKEAQAKATQEAEAKATKEAQAKATQEAEAKAAQKKAKEKILTEIIIDETRTAKLADSVSGINKQYVRTHIQEIPRNFAPHSYKTEDIPNINIVTRTLNIDFAPFTLAKDGKTYWGGGYQYRDAFKKLGMMESSDAGKSILVIGKNANNEKMVWFQGKTSRLDNVGRPVRALYVMTVPEGQDFSRVQIDLIKGMYGRTQEELAKELPLARSARVVVATTPYNYLSEAVVFDLDKMLQEVNHFAKGREISAELQNQIAKVDTLNPGEYIKLVY